MSAFSHTDWTVHCDAEMCTASLRSDELALQPGGSGQTARQIRKILKARGWAVAILVQVPDEDGYYRRRHQQDYCAKHNPRGAA